MATTIQVDEKTLLLLKRLKHHLEAKSYDEAIIKASFQALKPKVSMAGSLKKYLKKGETSEDIIKEMQNERRTSDRF